MNRGAVPVSSAPGSAKPAMTDTTATATTEDILAYSGAGGGLRGRDGERGIRRNRRCASAARADPVRVVGGPTPRNRSPSRDRASRDAAGSGSDAANQRRRPADWTAASGDRAWGGQTPLLNGVALSYLACCDTVEGALDDADVDWAHQGTASAVHRQRAGCGPRRPITR